MSYIFYFIIGFGIIYFVKRRKFNSRNSLGIEGYKTYESSIVNRVVNTLLKIIAYFIIIAGAMKCRENLYGKPIEKQDTEIGK